MSEIHDLFSDAVLLFIRAEIEAAGGNEVFFTGALDSEGVIHQVQVAARGHKKAVPVVKSAAGEASVLIHNHPSGFLSPSDADLDIAARYADTGTGFYIIDNQASAVYVVVEPVRTVELQRLDCAAVASLLDEGGPLAALSGQFESRPTQIELAAAVSAAFNGGLIGVFEAGTGVGKSFAYLLPAITWALDNLDRVVISTGTINLQQQLVEKDIPMAVRIIGRPVKYVLLKGRQNYLCKRRLAEALQDQDLFEEESSELALISEWSRVTVDGSRSDLSFVPTDTLWSRICSESDACMGMRCSFHEDCFVMRVRKEAASAAILVVNHHLLFADLEVRMAGTGYEDTAVLPPFKNIIFDEAHGMEAAATSFFSEYFTRFKLNKQIALLYRVRRGSVAGHMSTLARLSSAEGEYQCALSAIQSMKEEFSRAEDAAMALLGDNFSWRLSDSTAVAAQPLFETLRALRTAVAVFAGSVRNILEGISEDDLNDPVVWEAKFALRRLEFIGSLCLHFYEWDERRESVFWIEKNRLPARAGRSGEKTEGAWYPRFVQTPLSVAPMMKEGVFEPLRTIICTSATLRTGTSFAWWLFRTGVSLMEADRVLSGVYDSPFPYGKNVLLAIPEDAPLPEESGFQVYIEAAIIKLLQASAGHALVLFTSHESLRSACETARSVLASSGITIFRQGEDDRSRLLESFRQDEDSVLFATDSFWEGVDAPGDTLLQVIIAKLPFSVPNDPVLAARSEAIEKAGGSPFMELSLPEAVVRFRQGFGRLMRKKTDRGVVTVLDRRLLAKKYGRVFLESIPETQTCFQPLATVARKIETFLYP